jgi:hypothetical protein
MIVEEIVYPKRRLQTECRWLYNWLWNNRLKKDKIYLYPLKINDWFAILLPRYDRFLFDKIKEIDKMERFFFLDRLDRYTVVRIWCIKGHSTVEQLFQSLNISLTVLDR